MGIFSRKEKSKGKKADLESLNIQLTKAVVHEKPEEVSELLRLGANIDHISAMGNTVLQYACFHLNKEMITLLINEGADLFLIHKESGYTLLHIAAERNYLWLAKILVRKGLDVNAKDSYGNGPLFRAGKHHEIGRYLIDNGADPKMKNDHGVSPYSSDAEAFAWLKDNSQVIPNERTVDVFKAIKDKDLTSIALLTVKKQDFNQINNDGKTPLIYAIENNYVDIILLLIKNGAKTDFADSDGNTPLSLAKHYGYKDIEKILTEFDNEL